jgi:hypothetical protein
LDLEFLGGIGMASLALEFFCGIGITSLVLQFLCGIEIHNLKLKLRIWQHYSFVALEYKICFKILNLASGLHILHGIKIWHVMNPTQNLALEFQIWHRKSTFGIGISL